MPESLFLVRDVMLLVVSCHQSHNVKRHFRPIWSRTTEPPLRCNDQRHLLPIISLIICSSTQPCTNLLPIETKVARSCTNATLLSILYYMKPECNGIFLSSPKRLVYNASIELKRGSRIKCQGILRNDHGLLEYMSNG